MWKQGEAWMSVADWNGNKDAKCEPRELWAFRATHRKTSPGRKKTKKRDFGVFGINDHVEIGSAGRMRNARDAKIGQRYKQTVSSQCGGYLALMRQSQSTVALCKRNIKTPLSRSFWSIWFPTVKLCPLSLLLTINVSVKIKHKLKTEWIMNVSFFFFAGMKLKCWILWRGTLDPSQSAICCRANLCTAPKKKKCLTLFSLQDLPPATNPWAEP